MRPFRLLTCCPGMRPAVCALWAVVWLFSMAAPTLGWTGEDEGDGRLAHAAFSHLDEGGKLTADPTTSGTGDKEEDEQHSLESSSAIAGAPAHEAASLHIRASKRTRSCGVPARLEGRIWLLHCALKLDC